MGELMGGDVRFGKAALITLSGKLPRGGGGAKILPIAKRWGGGRPGKGPTEGLLQEGSLPIPLARDGEDIQISSNRRPRPLRRRSRFPSFQCPRRAGSGRSP